MLKIKTYSCGICKTTPDQISHHKSHIETQKHKDKKELFEFKLNKLSIQDLEKTYKTININDIIHEMETIIYMPNYKIDSNNNLSNNIILHTKEMDKKIEDNNNITNKEALKDKIHEIHNFLRNNGAGYGMNALKVFNIIYGLKKIEENNLLDKVNLLRPDCEFSHLLDLANKDKGEELVYLILHSILDSINNSDLKYILFYEIPRNIRGSVFVYLIKEINKITIIEKTCNVLLSGKIYEYFIGRDESAISELGAYFTDRHIVEYILKKLNPIINEDRTISSMIDMFGGSGGFTTGYINYLNNKYPELINWDTEINKVSHYDMNEDVIKSAGLEIFCLTGVLPNKDNLKYKNSFTDEFSGDTNNLYKYKYPLTNPPYGGDKNSKSEVQLKRDKVKEYIKNELLSITDDGLRIKRQQQLKSIENLDKQDKKDSDKTKVSVSGCSKRIQKFAHNNKLKGNDKESCSLMLLMDILDIGGTAIGVLKEGVFFNRTYTDLRKCLINNYNVREVISIPQDQFENTSTKTSIIIFDNIEEKTTEVKFSDLIVNRYTEDKFQEIYGNIVITENKGDIIEVNDIIVSIATKDEIINNKICSLNSKDYNKKKLIIGKEYELINLSNITDINMGATPSTTNHNYWDNGYIPWVAISDLNNNIIYNTKKCLTKYGAESMKNRKIPTNSILLSFKLSIGKLGITGREMYCNEAIVYLNTINSRVSQMYLYYILDGLNLEKYGRGTIGSHGNLNTAILKNIPIPVPKSIEKMQEWVDKISIPYNEKNIKQSQLIELELFIQNRIKEINENEECDEVKLDDICEIKYGTRITKQNNIEGDIPVYGGGDITFYTNKSNRTKNTLIISRYALSKCCVRLLYIDFYLNDSGLSIHSKDNKLQEYINYILLSQTKQEYIYKNCTSGSIQQNLNINLFNNIKIKIPINKQLIQDLEIIFQQIETLQNEVKDAEKLYKQYIQELSQEAIPQHNIIQNIEQININPIIENIMEDKQVKVKKIKKEKKIKK